MLTTLRNLSLALGLLLFATTACSQTDKAKQSDKVNNQWIIDDLVEKWAANKAYTMEVVESMPEEHFAYKPTDGQRTFQEQIVHISGNFKNLGKRVGIETIAEIDEANKTSIVAGLSTNFDAMIAFLAEMDPANLQEETKMWFGQATKNRVLNLMDNHLAHHRGQLIVYLRLKDVKPPRYVGW